MNTILRVTRGSLFFRATRCTATRASVASVKSVLGAWFSDAIR